MFSATNEIHGGLRGRIEALCLWLKDRGQVWTRAAVASASVEPLGEAPSVAVSVETSPDQVAVCTGCALHADRRRALWVDGEATARVMFVGDGPGSVEEEAGKPFAGEVGQMLTRIVAAMNLSASDVAYTNAVLCRVADGVAVGPREWDACRRFLDAQIDAIGPRVIVPLGAVATRALLGSEAVFAGLRGRWSALPGHADVAVLPTHHPRDLLRVPADKVQAWADLQLVMKKLQEECSSPV